MKYSLRSPSAAANRGRTLGFVVSAFLVSLLPNCVLGQYLHFHGPSGKPVLAVFQGNADWLTEQKDEKSHLHELKELVVLALVQHDISLAEMRYVARLKQLRSLKIGTAPEPVSIAEPAFAVLSECRFLEEVWICKKDLRDNDLEILQHLPNLKHITIEGENLGGERIPYQLTEKGASILASIKTLESVSIHGEGAFTDRSVEEFALLPKLAVLDIGATQCTDGALKTIASKMKLRELWISSPHFSEEGILTLKKNAGIAELHIPRPVPTSPSQTKVPLVDTKSPPRRNLFRRGRWHSLQK